MLVDTIVLGGCAPVFDLLLYSPNLKYIIRRLFFPYKHPVFPRLAPIVRLEKRNMSNAMNEHSDNCANSFTCTGVC